MAATNDIPPPISPDVVLRPLDTDGGCVAKNQRKKTYVKLGRQESFLLQQLDGRRTYGQVADSFQQRFQEAITCDEVEGFVRMAKDEGLVTRRRSAGPSETSSGTSGEPSDTSGAASSDESSNDTSVEPSGISSPESTGTPPSTASFETAGLLGLARRMIAAAKSQSVLYFRIKMFDPDKLLDWLEPRTRWLFSVQLAVTAIVGGLFAAAVTYANRGEIITMFASNIGWKTLVLAWCTTILVTVCHEFGHGLACKRYGGEVQEMGALWIFFTPCLYCNVSDAWLLSSRWNRLLISMAGTYVDFLIWIVSVVVWRTTEPTTALNYMAWIVVTTCGLRVTFNMNPLMRLDGYYALCDLLGTHNLRRRGRARWMEYVRWIFWGGPRPEPTAEGRRLLMYGVTCWFFTVGFLSILYFNIASVLQDYAGVAGVLAATGVFGQLSKKYFKGSLGEDFKDMFKTRRRRVFIWLAAVVAILLIPIRDRAGGPFHVRPVVRWEVRAPVAGFLREAFVDEGHQASAGERLFRVEIPELASNISRKEAEINEARANLRRLEAGPRSEEIAEQREKVKRAIQWRDLANSDLRRATAGLTEELAQLDVQVSTAVADVEYRETVYQRARQLYEKGGLAGQQLLAEKMKRHEAESELLQFRAKKRAREAEGVLAFEGELARREKELADTEATLALLEAGSRHEDIEAERARLARLNEEMKHLQHQRGQQEIHTPVAGTVITARLREKIGQYVDRGTPICIVEDLVNLEAEISVSEEDARVLKPGQPVNLKPRSLPFTNLAARVDRIAPAAATLGQPANASQNTVTVYCHVENTNGLLRTGMTGFGRIYARTRPLGWLAAYQVLRFVRTEFWW